MQIKISENNVVVEISSNAELAKLVKDLAELLNVKLNNPNGNYSTLYNFVNSHGNPSGSLVIRTEF